MNQNKLTFQSQTLVVDCISFKFQYLEDFTKTTIANYLFKIGFNYYQESGKFAKPIKQSIPSAKNLNPQNINDFCLTTRPLIFEIWLTNGAVIVARPTLSFPGGMVFVVGAVYRIVK